MPRWLSLSSEAFQLPPLRRALFASGGSQTAGELVCCCDVPLRHDRAVRDPLPHYVIMLEQVRQRAREFDILHFHIDFLHGPLVREFGSPSVTTQHGRLDSADPATFFEVFSDLPVVSISNSQRKQLPGAHWLATIYHGLPRHLLRYNARPAGGYLAFLGRISRDKGLEHAIEIAARSGMPLKIAAKIGRDDAAYWQHEIRPLIERHSNVQFLGEIGDGEKSNFLGNAAALLFPIDWPEPFGLVLIEAMACGTPVIAFRSGSVPEIVKDATSGFIVDSTDQAVAAVAWRARSARRAQRVRGAFHRRADGARLSRRLSGPDGQAYPLDIDGIAGGRPIFAPTAVSADESVAWRQRSRQPMAAGAALQPNGGVV